MKKTTIANENMILGGKEEATPEKQIIKISRKTVWENLEDAISIYMANKTNPYPITAGDWTIRDMSNGALNFMLLYNDFRCFAVEYKGNKTYHIGNKLDHDSKNYLGIGKKVTAILQRNGYTVDNALIFTAKQ